MAEEDVDRASLARAAAEDAAADAADAAAAAGVVPPGENPLHGIPADDGPPRFEDENALIVQRRLLSFFEEFTLADLLAGDGVAPPEDDPAVAGQVDPAETRLYQDQVQQMVNDGLTTLHVDFSHVLLRDHVLGEAILSDFYRFMPYLNKSVQTFARKLFPDYVQGDQGAADREFFVSFFNLPAVDRIRSLRTDKVGKLSAISGTVTRSSEVRPELLFGTFECLKCGAVVQDVEQQFKFTEPMTCTQCKKPTRWAHLHQEGKFVDWQKLRVQENANEVPAGSMPRTVEVIVRHEAVERAKPGDKCIFIGTLIAIPDVAKLKSPGDGPGMVRAQRGRNREESGQGVTGIKALGVREMSYKLAFLACSIQPINARFGNLHIRNANLTYQQQVHRLVQLQQRFNSSESLEEESPEQIREQYSAEDIEELSLMAQQPNLLQKMRRSIAPSVFGHEDIKLGILLMLFGGVHKKTRDGIKLRGDINVCIVGDPSTAKSQFLKYVCSFLPRAIYTSGKASSAAGLTASVVKDPETGEYCVEAGALMLADNGICCIDEFDKMDDTDQVAIHEAMEQQTISITKAGIQATLNARTSILAAANPIHGRYDRSKTLRANVQLSPAIMSRFDMFFVVLDECDESQDRIIAEHIIRVHQRRIKLLVEERDPEALEEQGDLHSPHLGAGAGADVVPNHQQNVFSTAQLQNYIRYARTIDPIIPPEVQPKLVECYRKLRQNDVMGGSRTAYRITVRQLEALIRLAEALARLHLDDVVRSRYVDWAYHLLRTSIVHVDSADVRFDDPGEEARPGGALRGYGAGESDVDDPMSESNSDSEDETGEPGGGEATASGSPNPASDGDEEGRKDGDAGAGDRTGEDAGASAARSRKSKKAKKAKRKATKQLSYEEYTRIANLLTSYLRMNEDEARKKNGVGAIRQRDVVRFYLSQRDDIASEEQLIEERRLINQIIKRLINKDDILMEVPRDTLPDEVLHPKKGGDGDSDDDDDDDDEDGGDDAFPEEQRFLVVHPNYVPGFR